MIVTFVHIWVKEAHVEAFIHASKENQAQSVKEQGNLRFDLVQSLDDPCKFVLYEAYESDDAAAAHKETSHYKKWRDTVADYMDKPRMGEKHAILAI